MGRRWAFPFITFALLLLGVIHFNSEVSEATNILSLDLEEDDGELTHGGTGDDWEWGVPGPNDPSNPGPDMAGDGTRAWGCPLNGTYAENADTYLLLPSFETTDLSALTLKYRTWYDLTLFDDERNNSGTDHPGDECLVEARVDRGLWQTLLRYTGSTDGSWIDGEIDLSSYLDGILEVRFHLIDNGDGYTDNGFFVDTIDLTGEERPDVSVELGDDPYIPPVVLVNEEVSIGYEIINRGKTVPPASYVSVFIEDISGAPEFFDQSEISATSSGHRTVEWYPSSAGPYRGWINLTVGGVYQQGSSFNIKCHTPVYYDDASYGMSHMTVQDGISGAEWNTVEPPVEGYSMSSGKVFWYGSTDGGPNGTTGFRGPTWAYIETDWIDLTYYTKSFLYIYHRYSFMGPRGSSGGVIEAYSETGGWLLLDPMDLSYSTLKENVSGPFGGEEGIVGTGDWDVTGFRLSSFIGGRTRLRFSVTADESGQGMGWWIDDIMVVGEGYDPFDTEPPAQIEGVDIEIVDEGAITLSWYPSNARDFDKYNVYLEGFQFSNIDGLVPYLELTSSDQDSVVITDLDPEKEYWVGITAVDIIGNEDQEINSISFVPSTSNDNRAPIADIKINGGSYARTVGEEITFDGSASYDPDGDPLTYTWTMPNGEVHRGKTTSWITDRAGEDLEIKLVVKDNVGAMDQEIVTIDVVEDDSSIIDRGDIWPFLIMVMPLIMIILFIILIAWLFRKSSKKRLEKRLERIGIDSNGNSRHSSPGGQDTRETRIKARSPKVHDVVAINKNEKVQKFHAEEIPQWDGPKVPELKPGPRKKEIEKDHHIKDHSAKEKLHYHPPPLVKVVIECPFCGEIFKEKVDPNLLKEHQVFTVKCPHCGRGGDINP